MTWLSRLFTTYDQAQRLEISDELKPLPISHTLQNAHIKVTIDSQGNFKRAEVLEKTQIVLPATEKSAGRSSGEAPHPLADKIQYVAGDYEKFGGLKKAYFKGYLKQLSDWCDSENSTDQIRAVKHYVEKGVLVADLVKSGICFVDDKGKLLTAWPEKSDQEVPKLFKILPKESKKKDQGSALVCWNVEDINFLVSETWLNQDIQKAWILYDTKNAAQKSLCYVTGQKLPVASNHPAKLRHTGDKAKLISANDLNGFTFKGRFTDSEKSIKAIGLQGASISYEVTQKAHNALRWLVSRQGYRNDTQAIVAWAVSCKDIPEPITTSLDLMAEYETVIDHSVDLGKKFGKELKKLISGYKAKLDHRDNIIILGLDSATQGRMGITFYQEFLPDEYLNKIEKWHNDFAWFQKVKFAEGKESSHKWLISTPSPKAIYEAIFGITISNSLKKKTVERILPCIVDGLPFPVDLMQAAVRRAVNRHSYPRDKQWLWEKNLEVACALFKGFSKRQKNAREYEMGLEKNNRNRDYLFGRLLAIAEKIEETALYVAGESRNTTATRLMQRFADRPASTWRNIELALNPYIQRLKVSRGGFLHNIQSELDEVMGMFDTSEFIMDKPLTGEFLLAFHSQRLEFNKKREDKASAENNHEK